MRQEQARNVGGRQKEASVGRCFKEEESVSRRRAWSVVSKTDDRASQTALFAPDSGRERLKKKMNEGGCI